MIEQDTIRLLRECDSGAKMGIKSLSQVLSHVSSHDCKKSLSDCRKEHLLLTDEINSLLDEYHDEGKNPPFIAEIFSNLKTKFMFLITPNDKSIANLITDGANMGTKSLNRYLNQYKAADEKSKNITKKLITVEDKLIMDIRVYL
jgi:hypothetical protein